MAGLSLFLVLVVGVVAWLALREGPYVAPSPAAPARQAEPDQAARALQVLERAVARGDTASAEGLAPAGDARASRLLAAAVTNGRALRVRDFALRYVDEEGAVSADGGWSAAVDATWRFAGFDRAPAHAEVLVRFAEEDGGVGIDSIGGGGRISPLWLSGPLQVRRTDHTLVLVSGSRAAADGYARRADAAVPVVRRVLPRWHGGLVVEVPATVGGLDRTLDADPGEYDNIAAVTTTTDGSLSPDAPVHVFVNPDVFGSLRAQGAQVVMSHEAVHVATDAALSTTPLWLLEGFADYVALRDVDLPLSTTAGQVIAQVRRDGPPDHLPGTAEFDTTTSHLGAAYESAWLACRLLARTGGEPALVRFYRAVEGGASVDAALRDTFGLSRQGFTRQWQALLSDLAG